MNSFDDLENPFEDPFAKSLGRSSSPDPWASFTAPSQLLSADSYDRAQPEVATPSATESESAQQQQQDDGPEQEPQAVSAFVADPLESAAFTAEEENEEPLGHESPSSPRKPGFRESVVTSFDEIATIRPTVPEDLEPSRPAYGPEPSPPLSPALFNQHHAERIASGSSAVSFGPSTSTSSATQSDRERIVVSPLEQSPSLDRPFASLALGGESIPSWQGPQSAWQDDTSVKPSASFSSKAEDDDDDDDQPIGTRLTAGEGSTPSTQPTPGVPAPRPLFQISVDDPQKVGDPIRGYTMYTVHTRTTSPLFAKSSFSVLRRYSDFLWLYETLSLNNPGVVVPPTPEKNTFGRFDDQFVQQRRLALEKCIQKIANHPVLCKDPDLKVFLESDTFALDIKHRKAEIAHERGGLMASIGQSIAGPRFYEMDEWFDRQKTYLDSLENQLRALVKAIELVAKHRTELATATGDFAQNVSDLSASDVGKQLSHSLASLADVERKAQEIQNAQAQSDMVTLMSTADEYARLINSVRLAFHGRIRTYHAWQNADNNVRRVKQAHENARAQGRQTLSHSLNQIAEAERRALEAKHEFDHVSKLIKAEVARFELERIEDFKNSLQAFLEGMISRQKTLIATWESYQHSLLKKTASLPLAPQEAVDAAG